MKLFCFLSICYLLEQSILIYFAEAVKSYSWTVTGVNYTIPKTTIKAEHNQFHDEYIKITTVYRVLHETAIPFVHRWI